MSKPTMIAWMIVEPARYISGFAKAGADHKPVVKSAVKNG